MDFLPALKGLLSLSNISKISLEASSGITGSQYNFAASLLPAYGLPIFNSKNLLAYATLFKSYNFHSNWISLGPVFSSLNFL